MRPAADVACDVYHGQWVPDPSPPPYTNASCAAISQHQDCQGNGRPDSGYEHWRWQPNGCALQRFNASEFARRMRRKSVLFIGDSVARNQMESLLCLLSQVRAEATQRGKAKRRGGGWVSMGGRAHCDSGVVKYGAHGHNPWLC